jgi:hypothetical protein
VGHKVLDWERGKRQDFLSIEQVQRSFLSLHTLLTDSRSLQDSLLLTVRKLGVSDINELHFALFSQVNVILFGNRVFVNVTKLI